MDSSMLMALIESRDQLRDELREAHAGLAVFATQIGRLIGFEVTPETNTREIVAALQVRLAQDAPDGA